MNKRSFIVGVGSFCVVAITCAGFIFLPSGCKESKRLALRYDIQEAIKQENVVPVVIIGSGPAGLAASLYTARGNIDTVVIEGNKPGGLLTDTTEVENWPGEKSILGPNLVHKMKEQVADFNVHFVSDAVSSVNFTRWPFTIKTEGDITIRALSVILATGAKPRMLSVPGEQKYWGFGVTSCATCDAPFFKSEDVVVVGGGDSAIEEAIQLAKYVNSVTILVRKDKMRAAARMQDRIAGYSNIAVRYNVSVCEVIGDGLQVTGVRLVDALTKEQLVMPVSGVFLAIGHDPLTQVFKDHVDTCPMGHIKMFDRTQGTSVQGVFAAGDVEDHRYRQAIVAAGHGVSAALDAIEFLHEVGFDQSVSQKISRKSVPALLQGQQAHVVEIGDLASFKEMIALHPLVIVDFYADYCPSCMRMLPDFEAVSAEYKDIVFIKVDANKAHALLEEYSVHKLPCILAFKDGALKARFKDAMNRKELREFIQKIAE